MAPRWNISKSELVFPDTKLSDLDMCLAKCFLLDEISWSSISLKYHNGKVIFDVKNLIITFLHQSNSSSSTNTPTPSDRLTYRPSSGNTLLNILPSLLVAGSNACCIVTDQNGVRLIELEINSFDVTISPAQGGSADLRVSRCSLLVHNGESNDHTKVVEAVNSDIRCKVSPEEYILDVSIDFLGVILEPSSIALLIDILGLEKTSEDGSGDSGGSASADARCDLEEFLTGTAQCGDSCISAGLQSALHLSDASSTAGTFNVSLRISTCTLTGGTSPGPPDAQHPLCTLRTLTASCSSPASPMGTLHIQCTCTEYLLDRQGPLYADLPQSGQENTDVPKASARGGHWLEIEYSFSPRGDETTGLPSPGQSKALSRHSVRIALRETLLLRVSEAFVCSILLMWRDAQAKLAALPSRRLFRRQSLGLDSSPYVPADRSEAEWVMDITCPALDLGVVLPFSGDALICRVCSIAIRNSTCCSEGVAEMQPKSSPYDSFRWTIASMDVVSWTNRGRVGMGIVSAKNMVLEVPQRSAMTILYGEVASMVQMHGGTMSHMQWHRHLSELFDAHAACSSYASTYSMAIDKVCLHASNMHCEAAVAVLAGVQAALRPYVVAKPSCIRRFRCSYLPIHSLALAIRDLEVVVSHVDRCAANGNKKHSCTWTARQLEVSCLDIDHGLVRSVSVSVKRMSPISLRRPASSEPLNEPYTSAANVDLITMELYGDVGGRLVLATHVTRPEGVFLTACRDHLYRPDVPYTTGNQWGLSFMSSFTSISIKRLECLVDPMVMTALLDIYVNALKLWNKAISRFQGYTGRLPFNVLTIDWIHFNSPPAADISCSQVSKGFIDALYIKMEYDGQPVGFWLSQGLCLGTLYVATPGVWQLCGSIRRLCLADLTEDTSCTKNLVEYASPAHPGDYACAADPVPMLEFHLTIYQSTRPLFEARSANLRVVYLQRAVLTMVDFLWQRVIVKLMNPDPHGPLIKPPPWEVLPIYDDIVYSTLHNSMCPFNGISDKGAIRFSWNISNSEIHIPVSSCSEDGIVFLFRRLQMFRYCVNYEFVEGGEGFSRGPQLRGGGSGVWISAMSAIESCGDVWPLNDSSVGDLSCKWIVLRYLTELVSPFAYDPAFTPLLHDGQMSIELTGGVICSWCSDNAIARNVHLHCLLTMQDVKPAPSGMYTAVFDILGYQCSLPLTLYVMELTMEDIDWVLSRGQYMAIVAMLSYNFCESNKVTPPLVGCEPINVQLNTHLRGKGCVDNTLPLFIAAPLLVGQGRIHMVENTREYYRKLFQAHKDNAALCAGGTDMHTQALQESAEYVRNWFRDDCPMPSEEADELTKRDRFRVPAWSTHHKFSRFMYFGVDYFEDSYSDGNCENESASGGDDMSDDNAGGKALLDSIGLVYFTSLEFTLFRRHHGGGVSMEVGADDFIITKGSLWTSFQPYAPSFGVSGPAGLKQSRVRENGSSEGRGGETDNTPYPSTRKHAKRRVHDPLDVLYDLDNIPPEFIIIKQRADLEGSLNGLPPMQSAGQSSQECQESGRSSRGDTQSIFYTQHSVGNLRRCVVHLWDCVAVAHVPAITRIINYFCESVFLADLREKEYMTGPLQLGSNNYRCLLDIEVYAVDTLVCFPNYSVKCEPDTRGICLGLSSLQYTHAYRGLLEAGPGWSGVIVAADVSNVFIAPLNDIDSKDVESIVSSMVVGFTDRYTVVPPSNKVYRNFSAVRKDMDVLFPNAPAICGGKEGYKSVYTQYMMLTIKPGDPICSEGDDNDDDLAAQVKAEALGLNLKLSIPDLKFILAVYDSLVSSFRNRVMRPPMKEVFATLFTSFHDIAHGMRYTDYMAYVPNAQVPELRVSEFILDTTSAHILVRNNTYGVKIMRLNIREPRYSFTKSNTGVNIAGGFGAMLFLHNPKMRTFDPVVENFKVTAICATDVSADAIVASATSDVDAVSPKLRFDLYVEPVEINVAHSMFVGAISKLSLGDVITSKSASLPVYRVVNKLGVPVKCKLMVGQYDDECFVSKDLAIDGTCAVDTRLYESSQSERLRNRRQSSGQQASAARNRSEDDSHTIEITFTMAGVRYSSVAPVPIDDEGIFGIQMRPRPHAKVSETSAEGEEGADDFVDATLPPELLYSQQTGSVLITVLMNMRVVDADGTRELMLRSVLSIRNNTDCALEMYSELREAVSGVQLKPEEEWFLPVDMICPQTRLYMRMCNHSLGNDEAMSEDDILDTLTTYSGYVKVWNSLYSFVQVRGDWVGAISRSLKLRGSLTTLCHDSSINGAYPELSQWTALLLPEPLDVVTADQEERQLPGRKSKRVVRYPTADSAAQEFVSGRESVYYSDDQSVQFQQQLFQSQSSASHRSPSSRRRFSFKVSRSGRSVEGGEGDEENLTRLQSDTKLQNIVPACINILPTIHFSNLMCQPILYRFREKKSLINSSEGTLLPGSTVNIYQNPFKLLYVSIRMLNYTWTPWFKIPAFPSSSKTFEEVLESPNMQHEDGPLRLPPLTFVVSCQDRFVQVYCPLWLVNRTGMNLYYREGSVLHHGSPADKTSNRVIPHRGIQRIENTLVQLTAPPSHNSTRELGDSLSAPLSTVAPFLADISKRASRHSRDRAGEHCVTFKICSPFDHCKTITVTMRESSSLEQLILEAVRRFIDTGCCVAEEGLPGVRIGAIRSSDYQAFHLGSSLPSLAVHSIITSDQVDNTVTSNTSSHSMSSTMSTPGGKVRYASEDVQADEGGLDASVSSSSTHSTQMPSHSAEATTNELDIRTVLGLNTAPYLNDAASELSHSTLLSAITAPHCIMLCHVSQSRIIEQIANVKIVSKRKETSVASRLGFKKLIPVLPFVHFEGDIPFNPGGMLGMFPTFSACVPNDTEWSNSMNVQKVDFAVTGAKHMDLIRARTPPTGHHGHDAAVSASSLYEMALLVQRGQGLYKHVAAVTIVPRLILSSKLPFALQIRQVVLDETGNVTQYSEPFVLLPGSVQQYHHPLNKSIKTVQMVQYSCTDDEEYLSMEWSGELNICVIGVAHVRLRNPDKIVNIRVESVGASSVATFSVQNLKWPPYRINNTTSFDVRVRQVCRKARKCLVAPDIAPPRTSIPFAWDYCFNYTEEKLLLQIDFSQIGNRCVSVEFPLNEVDHTATVSLTRPLPDLTQPVAEGLLEVKSNQSTDWKLTYCVVHSDTLFMFSNSRMNEIMGVINLSVPKRSEVSLDYFDGAVVESTREMEFACVKQYRKKEWDISTMLSKTIGLHAQPSDYDGLKEYYEDRKFWDINSLRRSMLSIATHCRLYQDLVDEALGQTASQPPPPPLGGDDERGGEELGTRGSVREESLTGPTAEIADSTGVDILLLALRAGFSVDELLHHTKSRAVRCADILSTLVTVKAAPNEKYAFYLLKEMCEKQYVRRVQVESSWSDGEMDGAPEVDLESLENDEGTGDVLVDLQFTDWLVLCAPSLAFEMETQIIPAREGSAKEVGSGGGLIFELDVGASSYRFKCSTSADLFRWMYGSRLCIEKAWMAHLLKSEGESEGDVLTVASLETAARISVRTDGPTKVLDIAEVAARSSSAAGAGLDGGVESDSPSAIPRLSEDKIIAEGDDESSAQSEEVFVSVFLPSIGVSVIDNQPTELCYLSMRDIQITVDRTSQNIMSALTIQYIQIDNQLLNPLYPVSFRPRTNTGQTSGADGDKKKVLMLPGLHQADGAFPTVHCFVQQRLSVGTSTTSFGRTEECESDLMYFDLLSMWIAPVELSLDEEILVRVLRVFRAIQVALEKVRSGTRISVDGEQLNDLDKNVSTLSTVQYQKLQSSGVQMYSSYSTTTSSLFLSKNIYFALLQLHPVDLVLSIRSTPDFTISSTEDNYLTLAVRVDYGHVKLNALMISNVFGMTTFITSILSKHYTHALLTQIYALIGSTDVVEGSVGLLTNLGTGVYDFFYEPIEGLLGDEQTFMEGLSKGGKSLASKAIGGTSAFTSKITGGLGRGMSMLTFDSRYQKNRAKDRLRAAQSVSEGLFVGSYEFGKNVFEGVTGIVVEPYRGWVAEGGKGLGKGIAKGILGVALKPAVGVLDLASRTTEGIRHAAFNTRLEADYLGITGRIRYPRQFGRFDELLCYDLNLATMQMIVDRLTQPTRETRFYVLHYLPIVRSLVIPSTSHGMCYEESSREISGYALGQRYFLLVGCDRLMLLRVRVLTGQAITGVKMVWTCPTSAIAEFRSDSKVDLVLVLKDDEKEMSYGVEYRDVWNSPHPSIHDPLMVDYYTFQDILENVWGYVIARAHPMIPPFDPARCIDLSRKRTGLKSIVKSYTTHQYRLYKNFLYEFTACPSDLRDDTYHVTDTGDAASQKSPEVVFNSQSSVGVFLETIFHPPCDTKTHEDDAPTHAVEELEDSRGMVLTGVIPLIDIRLYGPEQEDATRYSLSIKKRDTSALGFLRREDLKGKLSYSTRDSLTLLFPDRKTSQQWKVSLSESSYFTSSIGGAAGAGGGGAMEGLTMPSSLPMKRHLVIPLSGTELEAAERVKVEIAKNLSHR